MSTTPLFDMSKAVPIAQPSTPLFDMSKAVPTGANAPPATTVQQNLSQQKITDNPNGEGLYRMQQPGGQEMAIPYSNVQTARQQGYDFAGEKHFRLSTLKQTSDEAERYYKDNADEQAKKLSAQIMNDSQLREMAEGDGLDVVLGATKEMVRTALGAKDIIAGKPKTKSAARQFAEEPNQGFGEHVGAGLETTGEFMAGDELLKGLTKALGFAPKLADAAKIEGEIKKGTVAGRLFLSALRQGGIGAAQTYLKTGGDTEAALESGGETAALSGLTSLAVAGGTAARTAFKGAPPPVEAPPVTRTVGGVEVPVPAEEAAAKASPTAQASAQAYGNLSREAVAENMRKVSTSQSRVDELLNTTHDLTGAIDRQQELLKPAYDHLNELTDGRFRELNKEVNDARLMAKSGKPEDVAALQAKMSEMEALMDKASAGQGKLFTDYAANVKAAWRQNYILQDFGERWDRNLNGAPGASQVSNEQRGINGNGLMRDIQSAIRTYGRAHVEEGLGPGRLEQFEEIARLNQTNRQRKAFNIAVNEVAKELPNAERMSPWGKRAMAMTAGGAIAHATGQSPYFGMVAGEATYETTRAVMNALKTNPKIAQNFAFALESGANPKNYGPFIAAMIQKSREQQPQPETTTEDNQQ